MKRQSGLSCLMAALVGMLAFGLSVSAQTTVHLADDSVLTNTTATIAGKLPVLFVHGHGDPINYQKNWWDRLQDSGRDLPSFKEALLANSDLGVEPYYIQFSNNDARSITDDANEISEAVELILHRHDPNYPAQPTHVQIVIIAYSQGTISSRQYLKSLKTQVTGMPAPRTDFRPVSEFIAIAPPNHGLGTRIFSTTSSLSVKQLYNGSRPRTVLANRCGQSFGTPAADDYIEILNRRDSADTHVIEDTLLVNQGQIFDGEAPGSRADTGANGAPNPPTNGTLYVTLFDAQDRDIVGGDIPSGDCVGRAVALNMAPNAKNIPVGIQDLGWEHALELEILSLPINLFTDAEKKSVAVHQNTVHTPEVICKALYAAVHHRSPEGQTCGLTAADTNTVPTIPLPSRAAAMLTLDFSGSMGIRSCPDPSCKSRAEELQTAVALFIQLWKAVSVPSDRLGVTYFRTNVDHFLPASSNDPPPLLSVSGDDIINNVNLQTPHDWTAMGGGLNESLQSLNQLTAADTPIRRVILFTDGMQNVNPLVQTVGNDLVIADQPITQGSPVTVLNTLGIPIDTIGIGAGGSFVTLLRDIADRTGGRSWPTTDPAFDLHRFFVESLINALKGFSPQLVAYRHGSIGSGGRSKQDFAIEAGPRKVVLEVSWKRGDSLDFSVAKDGVDVTSAGRFITSATHKIFVIDFPAKGITASGNWQLRINGRAQTAYETAAIVDGERIRYDAMFSVRRPRAGDSLDFVVVLAADGQPVRSHAKVTIAWKSPTNTLGDVLAKYKPKDPPAAESRASALERQILALAYDPKAWAALQPKTQTTELKANDKGWFFKQFRPKIPGVYTAVVTIEGDDPKLGKFRRTLTATTVVGFANARLRGRDISVSETTVGGLRNVSVILSPGDKDGHLMGPGWSSNISLVSGGKVNSIQDLGDGRYLLVLALGPGEDPNIKLDVAGSTLFTGRLSKLPRK